MVGSTARVDRILLYAYMDTKRPSVLVQQAKYLQPYTVSRAPPTR